MFAQEKGLRPGNALTRQWRLLSKDEQAHYASLARAANLQAKVVQSCESRNEMEEESVTGGFWGMSAAHGFPLLPSMVENTLDHMHPMAEQFRVSTRDLLPESPDSFQAEPPQRFPLWAQCQTTACPHGLNPVRKACFAKMQELLVETVLRKGPKPTALGQDPMVLEFRSLRVSASRHVVVAYNTRKRPVDAALVELKALPLNETPAGLMAVLACEKRADEELPLLGDLQFCVSLANTATDWEMRILQVGPVRLLHHFDILGSVPVSWQDLQHEIVKEKEAKKALDALRRLQKKQQTPKAVQKNRQAPLAGRKGSAKGRGRGKGQAKGKYDVPSPDDDVTLFADRGSSRSDSQGEQEEEQSEENDTMGLFSAPEAEPLERPLARVDSVNRRRNVRRGQVWGSQPSFQIAPIHAAGSLTPTGWGAICGIHRDPSNPTLQCKKAMSCQHLSEDECKLRLKRWLVAGLNTAGWGDNQRECHVSLGGVQLSQFSVGLSHAELDERVSHRE